MKFNTLASIVKWIIPLIIFGLYFFYRETQYNVDGLWIYCGCLSLLHWQGFSGQIDHVKRNNSLSNRIELLEKAVMGEVMEESYEGKMNKGNLKKGLEKRVEELEQKSLKSG